MIEAQIVNGYSACMLASFWRWFADAWTLQGRKIRAMLDAGAAATDSPATDVQLNLPGVPSFNVSTEPRVSLCEFS